MQWLNENWPWLLFVIGLFLLMRQGGMGCGIGMHGSRHHRQTAQHQEPEGPVDPVSGERVPPDQAVTTQYQGRTYHFASPANRKAFEADPARYLHRHRGHGCC